MKRETVIFLSVLVGVAAFGFVIDKAGFDNIFDSFSSFSPLYLCLFLLTSAVNLVLSAARWKVIIKSMGHEVHLRTLTVYKIIGFAVGYITPSAHLGGEPVRGYLLKKDGVPGTSAFASLLIDLSSETVSRAAICFVGIIFFLFLFDIPANTALIFIVGLLIFSIIVIRFYFRIVKSKGAFSKILPLCGLTRFRFFADLNMQIEKMDQSMTHFLKYQRESVLSVLIISILITILLLVEVKFGLLAIGLNVGLVPVLLIIIFTTLTNLLPIPASLGILEIGQYSAFSLAGLNPYYGIAFSLLMRFRDSIWSLLGLIFLSGQGISLIDWLTRKKNGYNNRFENSS